MFYLSPTVCTFFTLWFHILYSCIMSFWFGIKNFVCCVYKYLNKYRLENKIYFSHYKLSQFFTFFLLFILFSMFPVLSVFLCSLALKVFLVLSAFLVFPIVVD